MEKEIVVYIDCLMGTEAFVETLASKLREQLREDVIEFVRQALVEATAVAEEKSVHVPTPEEVEHWEEQVRNGAYWVPSWYPTDEDGVPVAPPVLQAKQGSS